MDSAGLDGAIDQTFSQGVAVNGNQMASTRPAPFGVAREGA